MCVTRRKHHRERQHNARSNRRKQCRPKRNQTILQADTPAQKANYSHKRSHPTPLEADAHTSHVHVHACVICAATIPCNPAFAIKYKKLRWKNIQTPWHRQRTQKTNWNKIIGFWLFGRGLVYEIRQPTTEQD